MLIYDPVLEDNVDGALAQLQRPILLVTNGPSAHSGALNLRHVFEDSSIPFADPVEVGVTAF